MVARKYIDDPLLILDDPAGGFDPLMPGLAVLLGITAAGLVATLIQSRAEIQAG